MAVIPIDPLYETERRGRNLLHSFGDVVPPLSHFDIPAGSILAWDASLRAFRVTSGESFAQAVLPDPGCEIVRFSAGETAQIYLGGEGLTLGEFGNAPVPQDGTFTLSSPTSTTAINFYFNPSLPSLVKNIPDLTPWISLSNPPGIRMVTPGYYQMDIHIQLAKAGPLPLANDHHFYFIEIWLQQLNQPESVRYRHARHGISTKHPELNASHLFVNPLPGPGWDGTRLVCVKIFTNNGDADTYFHDASVTLRRIGCPTEQVGEGV